MIIIVLAFANYLPEIDEPTRWFYGAGIELLIEAWLFSALFYLVK
jgi:hypothetical protein